MPVLPIPMIIALLLFGLLIHRAATRNTHVTLLALIAVCAVQSVISALVHYYGLAAIRPLQPVCAMTIPPIAWLAFSQAAGGENIRRTALLHGIGPLLAIASLLINPMWLDTLIPLSFAGYGIAILLRLARGEDSLPHSLLDSGARAVWAWRIVGLSLIASAACDVWIAYNIATGNTGKMFWLPSLVSSLSLLSLGVLSLSNAIESRRDDNDEVEVLSQTEIDKDQAIIAKLDQMVAAQKLYLDPDLTLARLSRKLIVPAKQLSISINRVKAENVSRYINRQRVEEACRRLASGSNVTAAMLDSGFNTKSNFNREFLRVTGASPSAWLQRQAANLKSSGAGLKS